MFSFQCESGQVFMCQNQCVRVHHCVVDYVCVRCYCIDAVMELMRCVKECNWSVY